MANKKSSEERSLDMVRRTLAGETLQQIGDSYGITRERVRQLLQKAGCSIRAQQIRSLPKRQEAEARKKAAADRRAAKLEQARQWYAEYRAGGSTYTIGQEHGVPSQNVWYAINRKLRKKTRPRWKPTKLTAARISAGHLRRRQSATDQHPTL